MAIEITPTPLAHPAIDAVSMGHGFAWYPEPHIRDALATGRLKPLPLKEGRDRAVDIYLVFADPDFAGPGVRRLAEIVREEVRKATAVQSGATP